MKRYTISIKINGADVLFIIRATTIANAKELIKTRLLDALANAQVQNIEEI